MRCSGRCATAPACRRDQILDDNPIKNALDSIGKEEFLAHTAEALGAIGDPAAIPSLCRLVAAPGDHYDEPRPAAAHALATCLAAAPAPRELADSVLAAMLDVIRDRSDAELNAELHFAYGRVVAQLPPARREAARAQLERTPSSEDGPLPVLARRAALALTARGALDTETAAALRPLLHAAFTELDYDHEHTIRNIRLALRIGESLPALVDPDDLIGLTRFSEHEIRSRAHAILGGLGRPVRPASVIERHAAQRLTDEEVVELLDDEHVVNRATLIGEAERRSLDTARPAVLRAARAVIDRAREGSENLLDPDTRVLEAAVRFLRDDPDGDTIALFDRMLRHSNHHVKWELLQVPPEHDGLLPGMFHVLSEKWGWQEDAARQFLAAHQGTPAYEAARAMADPRGLAPTGPLNGKDRADDDDDDDDDDDEDDDDDDEQMN